VNRELNLNPPANRVDLNPEPIRDGEVNVNPEPIRDDEVLSASRTADALGVSVQAVIKRIKRGTLVGRKNGRRYEISGSEVNRLLSPEREPLDLPEVNPEREPLNPSDVNRETQFSEPDPSRVQVPDDSAEALTGQDRAAYEGQLAVYQIKLDSAEREHDTTRRAMERSEGEIDHLRSINSQQAVTIQNLAEEIKGLTVALHREQERHALPTAPMEALIEEPANLPKPGLFTRLFARNKRPRHVRIGHA
jgi:hypothetical protein